MLSGDMFSYLDSDNSSSNPEDSPDFLSDQVQQQLPEAPSLFEEIADVLDSTTMSIPHPDMTSSFVQKVQSVNQNASMKEIGINLDSDEEVDLINYLTGKTCDSKPPFLKLVKTIGENRLRNPSSVPFEDPGLCMSKNAIAAREMRQKKKAQIKNLERSLQTLQSENNDLKKQNSKMNSSVKELRDEVSYLRSILANQSALSGLLKNIASTPGVKFQSSFMTDYNKDKQTKTQKPIATVAGVSKGKACKRKVIYTGDSNYLLDENIPEECTTESKKSCYDHPYAAKPTRSRTANSKSLVSTISSSTNHPTDDLSMCPEDNLQSNAGVCLHVSKGCVSVELCSKCNNQANSRRNDSVEEVNFKNIHNL